MSKKISGNEYDLSDIFSSKFRYEIPNYQRPYAWTKEETGTLFDDLYGFYLNTHDENYFLGSIVLIKEENKTKAAVIDGQQRLTTLTILFAALASCFVDIEKKRLVEGYIREPGNMLEGREASPRLLLREKDQVFFDEHIQSKGVDNIAKAEAENEAQIHIQENCILLLSRLQKKFSTDEELLNFSKFLLKQCFIVAVSTPNQQSAFRVFSVMNSRGLDLLPIDIIKADLLGQIPVTEQDAYTKKWEALEEMTGRASFNELFGHIRMIFAKVKAKRMLLEEFNTQVFSDKDNKDPKKFIDRVLKPYVYAFSDIRGHSFEAAKNAEKINALLVWLGKINNADWIPVAVYFMAKYKNDSDYLLWFFSRLERLAAYLHICARGVNIRIERYASIIKEIDDRPESTLENPLRIIELTEEEKKAFISELDGEVYKLLAIRRNYTLLRLDSFVADGAASYDPSVLTIEHVLPQTVAEHSDWQQNWPYIEDREQWLHRIANLVPLTRKHNSSAQNFDFERKKKEYFANKNGTTSYALTSQVLQEITWTPIIVQARQAKLLEHLKRGWILY